MIAFSRCQWAGGCPSAPCQKRGSHLPAESTASGEEKGQRTCASRSLTPAQFAIPSASTSLPRTQKGTAQGSKRQLSSFHFTLFSRNGEKTETELLDLREDITEPRGSGSVYLLWVHLVCFNQYSPLAYCYSFYQFCINLQIPRDTPHRNANILNVIYLSIYFIY